MYFSNNIETQAIGKTIFSKANFFVLLFLLKFTFFFSQTLPYTTNLKLWLRADSGIVKNTNNTITAWNDVSGNNNNLTAPSGFEPIWDSSNVELSGKSTVKFTGFHYLTFNAPFSIDSFTIFYVGKKSFTSNYLLLFGDISAGAGIFNWIDGVTYIQSSSSSSAGLGMGHHTDYSAYAFMFDQQNMKGYKDGTLSSTVPFSFTGNFIYNFLGRTGFYNLNTFGEISEVLIYNSALPKQNRDSIEAYLYRKYSKPVDLGPDVSITNSFCDTTLSSKGSFSSYQWSTGATTPSISVTKSGKYWLSGTNIFGRSSSDTIIVNYPKYGFKDTTFCAGNFSNWNTNLPKNQFSFLWQDNTSNDSLFTITQAGDYHVKITDNFGCFVESDTITASLDNFETIASLGPDTSLCGGNQIYLKHGNSPGLTYLWNDGSSNDSLTINTSGQYSITITNSIGCVAIDTIDVTVLGQAPTASFLNSIACKNNLVSFTDNSTPPSGNIITSWFWNYGDGTSLADTSHLQNPFYTYTDSGNYTITLTIATDVGCKQTLIKNLHVAPTPSVNFNNIIPCKNDSALFTNSITTFGYPTTAYSWNFGDPSSGINNTSTLPNPKHLFSQQISYTVNLTATNSAGCNAVGTKSFTVRAQVTASFTNSPACTNGIITFQDNSIAPLPNNLNVRSWNFGTSTAGNVLTVLKSFSLAGTYPVTLTVNGQNGCVSSITKQINVMLPPIADFTLSTICLKDTALPIDISTAQNGSIVSWNWKLNNTSFATVQSPTLSPPSSATYTVELVASNSFGCKDSVDQPFVVFPLPNVDFITNPSAFYYTNSPITFVPIITNGSLYNWTINSSAYSISSPTVNFSSTGTYSATLYMEDVQGCGNIKNKTFLVANRLLDLAIMDVRTSKGSDNYISVEADLGNFGTTPITIFNLNYQISNAGSVQETYNGNLNPGSFMTYKFTAKSLAENNNDANITCVTIESTNTIADDNLSNNKLCVVSNSTNISVLNPYPDPAEGDVTLPIILDKNAEFKMEVSNSLGQIIIGENTQLGTAGLNLINIPTADLSRGCYFIKITVNDKIYIKKLLKTIRE